jgi:hypothetical protein
MEMTKTQTAITILKLTIFTAKNMIAITKKHIKESFGTGDTLDK